MEGYIFFLTDMISMLVRGAYMTILILLVIYFGYVKSDRQMFHYGFVYCCVGLLVALMIGTLMRLVQWSNSFYATTLGTLFEMMIIPLFAMFGYLLIRQPNRWKRYVWKFVASEIPYLLAIFYFLSQARNEQDAVLANNVIMLMLGYTVFYSVCCICIAYVYINWSLKKLKDAYSSIENRDLSWFRNILIALPLLLVMYVFMNYMIRGANDEHIHTLYLLISASLVVILAINLDRQRGFDIEMLEEVDAPIPIPNESSKALDDKLIEAFEKPCGFTKPDITVRQVSRMVGTNIHQLTRHLNDYRGMNFQQYVNKLRIDLACRMLANGEVGLGELFKVTGFRSYVTFSHLFKAQTGYSPVDYPKGEIGQSEGNDAVDRENSQEENEKPVAENQNVEIFSELNERELQLCQLIAEGLTNEELCEKMGISVSSLRVTRSRLRSKLGLERKESLDKYLEGYLKEAVRY